MRDPVAVRATVEANVPSNYKAVIAEHAKRDFFDPYSIRSAGITQPMPFGASVIVCVEANAKNRMGAYTGIQNTAYIFFEKELKDASPNNFIMCKSDMSYLPFPELESVK